MILEKNQLPKSLLTLEGVNKGIYTTARNNKCILDRSNAKLSITVLKVIDEMSVCRENWSQTNQKWSFALRIISEIGHWRTLGDSPMYLCSLDCRLRHLWTPRCLYKDAKSNQKHCLDNDWNIDNIFTTNEQELVAFDSQSVTYLKLRRSSTDFKETPKRDKYFINFA